MDDFLWFNYLTTLFSVVNVVLFLKSFIRNDKAFKIFAIYLTTIVVVQLVSIYVAKVLHKPNLYLSHIYFISQFIFLSYFYFELLKFKWIKIVLIIIMGFLGYQYINEPGIFFKYNSLGMAITHAIIVIYAVLYFYKSLDGKRKFIIGNIGIFLYLLSSTLIFASGNLVFNFSEKINYILIDTNRILIFVFQILIFVEWYRNYRVKKG